MSGYLEMPLKNGGCTKISPEDVDLFNAHKWRVETHGYVLMVCNNKRVKETRFHRMAMKAATGLHVHHINGDKLDNRRENLEVLTNTEHQFRHRAELVARMKATRVNPLTGTCKHCGVVYVSAPRHRARQVCCSKKCAMELAQLGRLTFRARFPKARLTPEQVIEIRQSPLPGAHFVRLYGVDNSTVSNVRTGKTWKNIEKELSSGRRPRDAVVG